MPKQTLVITGTLAGSGEECAALPLAKVTL
jgi:hypothetical protein